MSTATTAGTPVRPRDRRTIARLALIIPLIIVLALILGPVLYAVAETSRRAHQPGPTTSEPPTYTFLTTTTTAPGSCHTTADCPAGQVCVSGLCTNATTTTPSSSTSALSTTGTTTPGTTTSHASTATTATTTSTTTTARPVTTTRTTTVTTTTSAAFPSCQACSLNAVLGSCASEYASCQTNTYNCPVLCYGTFQLNGNPPATCTNGFIPQWPPLRDCICRTANMTCQSECTACAYTTVTSTPETTSPEAACEACYTTAVRGPCASQAAACNANPIGSCALVCAPYYKANLYIFEGCENVTYWPPLAACLCPYCGNNVTCTENQC
jgi:hypothetical protein